MWIVESVDTASRVNADLTNDIAISHKTYRSANQKKDFLESKEKYVQAFQHRKLLGQSNNTH